VVTGLSGSGKSSLAFDTIYAEGQRRYVETLSAYARQFLDQIERPDVDSIEGLSPAISIEQKTTSRSPRSTVGTITEIYDYLRLLYASIGTPHCPNCGKPIAHQTADQIVQRILELGRGERVTVMAPIVRGRKGEFKELLDQLDRQGFRARVDGELMDLSEPVLIDRRKNHTIEAVVDRILLKIPTADAPPLPPGKPSVEKRLDLAVAKALQLANGLVLVAVAGSEEQLFSSSMACPDCGLDVPKLEPRSFSFNSAFGACPECHGLGSLYDLDPAKVITDWSKPLLDGLGPGSTSQYLLKLINLAAVRYKIDLKTPFEELPPRQQHILVYGPPKGEGPRTGFHGVLSFLRDSIEEAHSDSYRESMMSYMSATPCPICRGKRLRPVSSHQPELHCARDAHCRAHPPRDRRASGVSLRRWPQLPLAGPQRGHAQRRRGSAHSPRHADRFTVARRSLRSRRTFHRTSSARQQPAHSSPGKAARPGQHRAGCRTR
jgi:excinuclease ABC subunit A